MANLDKSDRCQACGKTFCTNTGTPYHRLQHRRATFDDVAALSVEGLNKSAIARVEQIAWNTVDRWLERVADSCRRPWNRSSCRRNFLDAAKRSGGVSPSVVGLVPV